MHVPAFLPNRLTASALQLLSVFDCTSQIPTEFLQVYKRVVGETYKLKMAASRAVMSEVIKKFPSLPFALRSLEAKNARWGTDLLPLFLISLAFSFHQVLAII